MPAPQHGWTHRPRSVGGTDPAFIPGQYEIKVFGESEPVETGDGAFKLLIPPDLDRWYLVRAEAGIPADQTVDASIQVSNNTQAVDMLSTVITIDAAEGVSFGPSATSTPSAISVANSQVNEGDWIWIDVDAGDGTGLNVILNFWKESL